MYNTIFYKIQFFNVLILKNLYYKCLVKQEGSGRSQVSMVRKDWATNVLQWYLQREAIK